jgi:hypothetical protein
MEVPRSDFQVIADLQDKEKLTWQTAFGIQAEVSHVTIQGRKERVGVPPHVDLILSPTTIADFKKLVEGPLFVGRNVVRRPLPYINAATVPLNDVYDKGDCRFCRIRSKHNGACPIKAGLLRRRRWEIIRKMIVTICGQESPAMSFLPDKPPNFDELVEKHPTLFPIPVSIAPTKPVDTRQVSEKAKMMVENELRKQPNLQDEQNTGIEEKLQATSSQAMDIDSSTPDPHLKAKSPLARNDEALAKSDVKKHVSKATKSKIQSLKGPTGQRSIEDMLGYSRKKGYQHTSSSSKNSLSSESGGGGSSKSEWGSGTLSFGGRLFHCSDVPGDGDCFFHSLRKFEILSLEPRDQRAAIAEIIALSKDSVVRILSKVVDELAEDEYHAIMREIITPKEWISLTAAIAISWALQVNIKILSRAPGASVNAGEVAEVPEEARSVWMVFHRQGSPTSEERPNHYMPAVPMEDTLWSDIKVIDTIQENVTGEDYDEPAQDDLPINFVADDAPVPDLTTATTTITQWNCTNITHDTRLHILRDFLLESPSQIVCLQEARVTCIEIPGYHVETTDDGLAVTLIQDDLIYRRRSDVEELLPRSTIVLEICSAPQVLVVNTYMNPSNTADPRVHG